jgi:hypothetical protein
MARKRLLKIDKQYLQITIWNLVFE